MSTLYGLIPAAGKGTRARPYTSEVPKSMLEINGKPNLQRNIELMRDAMGIRDIVIVTGYLHQVIEDYFKDGKAYGVNIHYVRNNDVDKGLAWSIFLGSQVIDDYFCVILSDECYVNSNHAEILSIPYRDSFGICTIRTVDDVSLIRKNYSVRAKGTRIEGLIEKPKTIENDILGCGTFLFSPEIFPLLAHAYETAPKGYVEFVTFLDDLCRQGKKLSTFELDGSYVNINDRDSLHLANYHDRCAHYSRLKKSLLIYSEGVESNVGFTIERYSNLGALDSIHLIVPFENSIELIARNHGVSIIRCPPGVNSYGEKISYALEQVNSDIIVLTEADYTFPARDVEKLLAYLKEADMVVGTRTTRQMMEQGSDLEGHVRTANVLLAKIMELLWWRFEGRFTDVGCTLRAIWRSSYQAIRDDLHATGPEFSAEMIVELLNKRMQVLEIPVNYHNVSRAMSKKYRNLNTFFKFLSLFIKKRFVTKR